MQKIIIVRIIRLIRIGLLVEGIVRILFHNVCTLVGKR